MALMVCLTFGLTTTSFAQVRIDKNKSYKAAWKINTYELKLDANDGRGIIENRKVKYKDSYGKLPDINRDYYDLIGCNLGRLRRVDHEVRGSRPSWPTW